MVFTEILKSLSGRTGARGAVMIDRDGEIVASWPESSGLDMALVGAHYEIILDSVKTAAPKRFGRVGSVFITTDSARVAIFALKDEYCLVVALERNAPTRRVINESSRAAELIEKEMG